MFDDVIMFTVVKIGDAKTRSELTWNAHRVSGSTDNYGANQDRVWLRILDDLEVLGYVRKNRDQTYEPTKDGIEHFDNKSLEMYRIASWAQAHRSGLY
jgi:hypothetical protein